MTDAYPRKKFIAGNWKMHKTRGDVETFFQTFNRLISESGGFSQIAERYDVAFGVPATLFETCEQGVKSTGVRILAQNCHWEAQGAFTGELSVPMLKDAGVHGAIIGHSERRQYNGETNEAVGKKWQALSRGGLLPVICIGESRSEREAGKTEEVLSVQLRETLSQVSKDSLGHDFVIAYEPVWAIGTGLTATPDQAEAAHVFIRRELAELTSKACSEAVRIIYGGSMNPSNARELLGCPNIDGGLIGGASLKAEDFVRILL